MKVKIGGIDYKIKYKKELKGEFVELSGQTNFSKATIKLDKNLGKEVEKVTLLHEIMHGLLCHAGLVGDHDELYIEILSAGIHQVLKDNPKLVKFLLK